MYRVEEKPCSQPPHLFSATYVWQHVLSIECRYFHDIWVLFVQYLFGVRTDLDMEAKVEARKRGRRESDSSISSQSSLWLIGGSDSNVNDDKRQL
jgi:hypothetical protein